MICLLSVWDLFAHRDVPFAAVLYRQSRSQGISPESLYAHSLANVPEYVNLFIIRQRRTGRRPEKHPCKIIQIRDLPLFAFARNIHSAM